MAWGIWDLVEPVSYYMQSRSRPFMFFLADEEQGGCLCRVQTIKRNHADEVLPRLQSCEGLNVPEKAAPAAEINYCCTMTFAQPSNVRNRQK